MDPRSPMNPAEGATPAFAVVTDSTCDLGPERAADLGVTVVPISITIGAQTFDDGVLTQAELFERMGAQAQLPTTAAPGAGRFREAYEAALAHAPEVVSLHIGAGLSGTFEAARLAAQEFAGRVHVFDSRNLSWGLGWQVLDAVAAAREGLSAQAALQRLERTRDQVKQIVTLDSLENLRKGGRIGAVSSALGSILNLKVTIVVTPEGTFIPYARSRGDHAALERMLGWIEEQLGPSRRGRFAIGHAIALPKAQRLAQAIRERFDATEVFLYEAGASISTHAGSIWGTSFWPEP